MPVNHASRFIQIGLDRMVRLEWLEKTASLVLAGNEDGVVKETLQADLGPAFRSDNPAVRGSLDKTVTILMKVWLRTPRDLAALRQEGLRLLAKTPKNQRMIIHWGMVMAAYPFWAGVAAQTGRLLNLQETATAMQVQRRVREQYGERELVSRRARYVLRSYVDWGVLKETEAKGIYKPSVPLRVESKELKLFLLEASLNANPKQSATFKELLNNQALFPFQVGELCAGSLSSATSRIEVLRHGFDDDLVILKQ